MEDHKNQTFTQKLYHILTLNSPHVFWSQDGRYFIIPSPEKFSSEILPTHYSHCNFASFVRQLNMYGFRKLADMSQIGSTSWCFEHSFFTRDSVDFSKIERKVKTKTKAILPPSNAIVDIKKEAIVTSNAITSSSTAATTTGSYPELKEILPKMNESKELLNRFDNRIANLQNENLKLWEEIAHIDDLAKSQEEINNKLLNFITSNIAYPSDVPLIKREGVPHRAQRQLSWDGLNSPLPSAKRPFVTEIKEEPIDEDWRSLLSTDPFQMNEIAAVHS